MVAFIADAAVAVAIAAGLVAAQEGWQRYIDWRVAVLLLLDGIRCGCLPYKGSLLLEPCPSMPDVEYSEHYTRQGEVVKDTCRAARDEGLPCCTVNK
jgi:hypothetical protein